MKEISLLHIGDVHFEFIDKTDRQIDKKDKLFPEKIDQILPRKSYQNVIKVLLKEIRKSPSAILMSGDLSSYGDMDSYKDCLSFFKDKMLAELFNKNNIFIVPGNHDFDREKSFDEKFQSINNTLNYMKFPKIPYPKVKIKKIEGEKLDDGEESSGLLIITINSCVGCGEKRYYPQQIRDLLSKIMTVNCKKQKELCYEDIDTPIFTEDDIDEVIENIKAEKTYLPIILTHHNLLPQRRPRIAMYTELINSGYFRDRLEKLNKTIIYLHGHVHDNPIEIIQSGKNKYSKIICISAPLLFPNTEFETKNFGFNRINIILGSHGIALGCKITYYRISDGVDEKEEERIRFINPPESIYFATQDEIDIFNSINRETQDIHLVRVLDIVKRENGENFTINEIEASVDRLDWLGLVNYSPKNDDPIETRVIKKVIPS